MTCSTKAAINLTEIVIYATCKKTKNWVVKWPACGYYVHALSGIVTTQTEKHLVFEERNTGL